jgi:Elongation factor Tu GTP binding domain
MFALAYCLRVGQGLCVTRTRKGSVGLGSLCPAKETYMGRGSSSIFCREAKEKNRESWYMAYIMDTNEEERAKGKTVEVGRAHFETAVKRYTILDAPGHKNYVPNMIGGAAQADIGALIISGRKVRRPARWRQLFSRWAGRSVSRPVGRPAGRSVSQSDRQTDSRLASHSIGQSDSGPASQSYSRSVGWSVSQRSASQSVGQQSLLTSQCISHGR